MTTVCGGLKHLRFFVSFQTTTGSHHQSTKAFQPAMSSTLEMTLTEVQFMSDGNLIHIFTIFLNPKVSILPVPSTTAINFQQRSFLANRLATYHTMAWRFSSHTLSICRELDSTGLLPVTDIRQKGLLLLEIL